MNKLTPCQSIKRYCKEQCCVGDIESWKNCTAINCYLYLFRLGKRPKAIDIQNQKDNPKHIVLPSFFERNIYSKTRKLLKEALEEKEEK